MATRDMGDSSLDRNSETTVNIQLATVNGVLGIVGLTEVVGGVSTLEFHPLTATLAKKLDILDQYEKMTNAQKIRADELVASGKLRDTAWLRDNIEFLGGTEKQHAWLKGELQDIIQYHPQKLARAFTKGDSKKLKFIFDLIAETDTEAVTCATENIIVINNHLWVLEKDITEKLHSDKTIVHEIDHVGEIRIPDLNPREACIANIVNETAAYLTKTEDSWNKYLEAVKKANTRVELIKACEKFGSSEEFADLLIELGKKHNCSWENFLYILKQKEMGEKFAEIFADQLSREDYVRQTFMHGLIRQNDVKSGNIVVLRKYIENTAQRFGLSDDAMKTLWRDVEAYATGKKDLPGLHGVFTNTGFLSVPNSMIPLLKENFDLSTKLDDPVGLMRKFGDKMPLDWAQNCPHEFLNKLKAAGYTEMISADKLSKLRDIVGNLGRFDSYSGKELMSADEVFALRTGLVKNGQKQAIENKLSQLSLDVQAGKIYRGDSFPKFSGSSQNSNTTTVSQKRRPNQAHDEKTQRRVSAGHGLGSAAVHLGTRVGFIYAANRAGRHLQNWESANKNAGGQLMNVASNTSLAMQRADQLLQIGGLGVMGVGTAITVGQAIGKAGLKTGAGRAAAKTVPVVGTALGLGYAVRRAWDGDWIGAGMELGSAGMDIVTAVGGVTGPGEVALMAASASIDATIAARDAAMKDGVCDFAMTDTRGIPYRVRDSEGNLSCMLGARINYKHNQKNGAAVWYGLSPDGRSNYLAVVGSFKNDKPDGEWLVYDEHGAVKKGDKWTGNVLERAHYKNGVLVDEYKRVDKNGRLIAEGNFTNGEYIEYWTDQNGLSTGVQRRVGQFKNGKPVGEWSFFDSKGNPQLALDYDKNQVATVDRDKNGVPVLDENGEFKTNIRSMTQDEKNNLMRPDRDLSETGRKRSDGDAAQYSLITYQDKQGHVHQGYYGVHDHCLYEENQDGSLGRKLGRVDAKTSTTMWGDKITSRKWNNFVIPGKQPKAPEVNKEAEGQKKAINSTTQHSNSQPNARMRHEMGSMLPTGSSQKSPQKMKNNGVATGIYAAGKRVRTAVVNRIGAVIPAAPAPAKPIEHANESNQTSVTTVVPPQKVKNPTVSSSTINEYPSASEPKPRSKKTTTQEAHRPGYVVAGESVLKAGVSGTKEIGRYNPRTGEYKGESFDVAYSGQYDPSWNHPGGYPGGVVLDGHGDIFKNVDGKLTNVGTYDANQVGTMVATENRTDTKAAAPTKTAKGTFGKLKAVGEAIVNGVMNQQSTKGTAGHGNQANSNPVTSLRAIGEAIVNGVSHSNENAANAPSSGKSTVSEALEVVAKTSPVLGGLHLAKQVIRAGVKITKGMGQAKSGAKQGRSKSNG